MHLTYRKTCRLCGSPSLTRVISLGDQYLQGVFIKDTDDPFSRRRVSMSLVRCDPANDERACGLLQTEHSVPPELMYRLYWYRSGTNRTMRDHLKSIVDTVLGLHSEKVERVLDIGCNDGTLLSYFPKEIRKIGVDPSNIIPSSTSEVMYIRDFFPSTELRSHLKNKTFDVITSIAMFYDLEDPIGFVREIVDLLSPNGLWVVEVSYMPKMLADGAYDSICHEHLEYYSFAVLEHALERNGLKIIRAEFNSMNGGSIRCFITHASSFLYKNDEDMLKLREIRISEFDLALDTETPYRLFQARMEQQRGELKTLLRELKSQGKSIHLYGASTKGNTLLQWCDIDTRLVDCAADRNPEKWGAKTPGTEIPIVSEEVSRTAKPDYYLVLPWHFEEEFIEREKSALEAGTKFIFPLPKVRVLGKN